MSITASGTGLIGRKKELKHIIRCLKKGENDEKLDKSNDSVNDEIEKGMQLPCEVKVEVSGEMKKGVDANGKIAVAHFFDHLCHAGYCIGERGKV